VERTKSRPLAAALVTPKQAIGFLAGQLSTGLAVLTQLNWNRLILLIFISWLTIQVSCWAHRQWGWWLRIRWQNVIQIGRKPFSVSSNAFACNQPKFTHRPYL
jgi:heme O synthase-like polyprenyltransferase